MLRHPRLKRRLFNPATEVSATQAPQPGRNRSAAGMNRESVESARGTESGEQQVHHARNGGQTVDLLGTAKLRQIPRPKHGPRLDPDYLRGPQPEQQIEHQAERTIPGQQRQA